MAKLPKKLPAKLGDLIDLAFNLRAKRKALEAEAEAINEEEKRIKLHILNTFRKDEIEGAKGRAGSATLTAKDVPVVKDWPAFYEYILKTKQLDLLQRRPAEGACQERWESGEQLPGVEKFHKIDLSMRGT